MAKTRQGPLFSGGRRHDWSVEAVPRQSYQSDNLFNQSAIEFSANAGTSSFRPFHCVKALSAQIDSPTHDQTLDVDHLGGGAEIDS